MKFILEKEETIISSDSTITIKADSVIECIMLCTNKQECETASYDRTTEQCKLDSNCNPETGKNKTGTLVLKSYVPTDCSNIPQGSRNGVYKIFVNNRCIDVYCDMTDGGWTVIQRRLYVGRYRYPISFMRDWAAYKKGFGEVIREYWLDL
ncbi:techylectin-5B-like [Mytilus edulis]|uniref:techylectin-5B-like n=1 Tax=Mytilus edulis TaxID=6550 RepID=UPI0039EFC449